MPQTVSRQTTRWKNARFQCERSTGYRQAKRKISGVRIAHGNWSRIAACSACVHGRPVLETKLIPRTSETMPQPAKERSQPLRSGRKGQKKLKVVNRLATPPVLSRPETRAVVARPPRFCHPHFHKDKAGADAT